MKAPTLKAGQRGRSALTKVSNVAPTKLNSAERKSAVNRAVDAGDHRGDRRDMSKTYSGNAKHASRGNSPRKDVSTRKR